MRLIEQLREKGFDLPRASLFAIAERSVLEEAMELSGNCQRCMARIIGVSPRVVNYKMQKFGMRPKDSGGKRTSSPCGRHWAPSPVWRPCPDLEEEPPS